MADNGYAQAHPNVPLPRVIHATHHVPKHARVIIVGDVHGCFEELQNLLQSCAYSAANDVLVFVGDLVNKGPKSVEVVRFVRESGSLCVRGNHDDAALNAYYKRHTDPDPRYDYVNLFSAEDVEFLEQLPFTIDLPEINALVVHAGIVPGVPLEKQSLSSLYKMRFLKANPSATPLEAEEQGSVQWAQQYHGPKLVVFGHDAKAGLQDTPYALGLDTGCCYGKKLTAVILPERRLVSVPALSMYTAPKSKQPSSWMDWIMHFFR
ncbi:unnamed protein product [Aphanomyces euteiches]|uniref:Calcineurin-like phosphoesterase domain-containing protein n=1 Tax=Aphanomyces euteiches TaxID=100861 RepID=A0A6G0X0E7_9STRA|nr:hypothetical protein Ae201684_009807 [Aphanomyces euteiches]KAH9150692.1 hypothetical protein AeRB84_006514 [Aphanomyces euteiches]